MSVTDKPAEKHHVVWTFLYRLANGEVGQNIITNGDVNAASVEFHAIMQLQRKYARDGYKITGIESNHITGSLLTPQRYLEGELPPRNPDASKFVLGDALRWRLFPMERPQRAAKGAIKEEKKRE